MGCMASDISAALGTSGSVYGILHLGGSFDEEVRHFVFSVEDGADGRSFASGHLYMSREYTAMVHSLREGPRLAKGPQTRPGLYRRMAAGGEE